MSACERYEADLSALLDGELEDAKKEELYAHMADCPECSALYESFSLLHLDAQEPPADLTKRIMEAVREEAKPDNITPLPKQKNRWLPWLAAAACFVLIVGAIAIPRLNPSGGSGAKVASRALPLPTQDTSGTGEAQPTGTPVLGDANDVKQDDRVNVSEPLVLHDADQIDAVTAILADPVPAEAPDADTPPLLKLSDEDAETTIYLDGDDVVFTSDDAQYQLCEGAAEALIEYLEQLP